MATLTLHSQPRSRFSRALRPTPIRRGPLTLDATQHGEELQRLVLHGIRETMKAKRGVEHRDAVKDALRDDRHVSLAHYGRALTVLSQHEPTAFQRYLVRPIAGWVQSLAPDVPVCLVASWHVSEDAEGVANSAERRAIMDTNDPAALDRMIDALTEELFTKRRTLNAALAKRRALRMGGRSA